MATLQLSRSAQAQLGSRHHQRTRRLIQESRQPQDWELPDELPPVRGMAIEQCRRGMLVQELISPHRRGYIVGFKTITGVRCALVDWEPFRSFCGHRSAINPAVIQEIAQTETPSSEPEPLPDGVRWKQLSLF